MDKVKKIEEFCKETIAELNGYINYSSNDTYSELEQHDCKVAIKQYELVLRFIRDMEKF